MKRLLATALAALIAAGAAPLGAETTNADTLPPVQPPPDMDAPATKSAPASAAPVVPLANSDDEARAAAAAEAKASAERARALATPTLPATPAVPATLEPGKPLESPGLPADVQRAAEATELPVITVRQNGNERVEEYRRKGILYFVRVVPPEGPPRYYVDNRSDIPPDMRQLSAPSGHVEPVYFRLFEWK